MFSCFQSVKTRFTERPQIPSCPTSCFCCCFELLPTRRFLCWESCVFQANPLQNSLTPSCVKGVTHPAIQYPLHTHNTWDVPLCLLHSQSDGCLQFLLVESTSCRQSSAFMLRVSIIDSSASIMGCPCVEAWHPSLACKTMAAVVLDPLFNIPSHAAQSLLFHFPRQINFCAEYNRYP